jgi:hypothetical protein
VLGIEVIFVRVLIPFGYDSLVHRLGRKHISIDAELHGRTK